jgi:hypothetical protein
MPRLFDDESIMFSASTRTGGEGLYSIRPESGTANLSGPALPLLSASTSSVEPLHSVLVVSVASNEHGRLAYLGGPIESLASQKLSHSTYGGPSAEPAIVGAFVADQKRGKIAFTYTWKKVNPAPWPCLSDVSRSVVAPASQIS